MDPQLDTAQATEPLASRFFEASRQSQSLEYELDEAIIRIMGKDPEHPESWGFGDITYDDYDASFELRGCTEKFTLTRERKTALRELGFVQCWFCEKPKGQYDRGIHHSFV